MKGVDYLNRWLSISSTSSKVPRFFVGVEPLDSNVDELLKSLYVDCMSSNVLIRDLGLLLSKTSSNSHVYVT